MVRTARPQAHPPLVWLYAAPHHNRVATDARSAPIEFRVERKRFSSVLLRAALLLLVFGISTAFACARIYEAPHSALTWLRASVSLLALGIVVFAKNRTIAQRVVLAFVLESASGIAIFLYVDLPFVTSHAPQIAGCVAASYARLTHRDIVTDIHGLSRER